MRKEKKTVPIEVFEKRGGLSILLSLINHKGEKPMNISDLVKATGVNRETILRTVTALKIYGIVADEETRKTKGTFTGDHYVWLTPLGREAAQYMVGFARALGHPKTPSEPSSGEEQP